MPRKKSQVVRMMTWLVISKQCLNKLCIVLNRRNMKEFDLIAMRGRSSLSNFIAQVQSWVEGESHITHIGIIVSRRVLPQLNRDGLYILESTRISHREVEDEEKGKFSGVQLRSLDAILDSCKERAEEVYHLPLRANILFTETLRQMMGRIYYNYYYSTYPVNPLKLSSCVIGYRVIHSLFPDKRPFCSELVGLIYQELGLIDMKINSATLSPEWFFQNRQLTDDPVKIVFCETDEKDATV